MESDNKYAIMNAGDAITLQFDMDQVDNLAEGWKRDFIFYNDGWLKDGDLNTAHGQTVEPLPFHGMTRYPYGDEQSYPATKEYQDYQREYNTREVSTEPFKKWLLNKSLGKK